jgi:hypothetical protein
LRIGALERFNKGMRQVKEALFSKKAFLFAV